MDHREIGLQGSTVNVILVNITKMTADLLQLAFASQAVVNLSTTAATVAELKSVLRKSSPDIALIGSEGSRSPSSALPFLEQVSLESPLVRSIVISEDMGQEDVVAIFRAGARGLLCKSETNVSVLMKCIVCVSAGQVWANSRQLELLLRSLSEPRALKVTNVKGQDLLSQREEQVLGFLAHGLSNRELAKALKLSEHTVKNHLFRIFDKLGVSNRMEAVLFALNHRRQEVRPDHETSSPSSVTGAA
jgi:DNA-binding NarL/FixJ family response regulator